MAPHLMWVNLIIVSPHTMNHRGKNMRIFRYLRLGIGRFGLGIGAVIGIILALVVVLNWLFGIPVAQAVTAVGSVSTAVGVFLAFLALRSTHEWNRRSYTAEFLDDWNESARIIWQYLRGNSQIFLLSQTL